MLLLLLVELNSRSQIPFSTFADGCVLGATRSPAEPCREPFVLPGIAVEMLFNADIYANVVLVTVVVS